MLWGTLFIQIWYMRTVDGILFTFLASFLLFPFFLSAQETKGIQLRGNILEAVTKDPVPFAGIRLFSEKDSSLVAGALSEENGKFELEATAGRYYLLVNAVGFDSFIRPNIELSTQQQLVLLEELLLTNTNTLEEVVIRAEKSSMELSLDKRIFNVGKDLANAGGSAAEILNNIPSVTVDQDGNVKLRGNDNVRILVDGKPSGFVSFKGGSGLQQLQGSMIEKVEIVTNPSARYEAEGATGVINIVLKKENREGVNGSFELITGYPSNYGAAANVNYRRKKVNFFLNYGLSFRNQPGRGALYQELYQQDTTYLLDQQSKSWSRGWSNNVKGGLDIFLNSQNTLTASYLLRRTDFNRLNDIVYKDFIFSQDQPLFVTTRSQDEVEQEPNSEYALTWKKTYAREGHSLTADLRFLDYWERSDQTFTQNSTFPDGSSNAENSLVQQSLNDEFEKQYLFQLDYVRPISKEGKVELGVRTSFRDMINDFGVQQQLSSGAWRQLDSLTNYFIYDENILAAYAIYGNKWNQFSMQLGTRWEYTDVLTELRETKEQNPRDYANFFPSLHLSYELPANNALQISYSRRVRRPRYNELSPFVTFSDNRNFWSGNPDLDPEFTDVVDFGHIKYFDRGSFTSSLYYRFTTGKTERIRSVDERGYSRTRPENLKDEHAVGLEFTGQFTPVSWWKTDLNLNAFHSVIDGSNINAAYVSRTFTWTARHTSRFTLPKDVDIQARVNYEAPQNTPQGRRRALYFLDLGVNKDILNGNGTLALNVSDLLNSRRWRNITRGDNFYAEGFYQWRLRQTNLTFTYRLNQAKSASKQNMESES